MNKSTRFGFFAFLLLVAFIGSPLAVSAQICTQDAMLCPDGTGVGRSGPNCTFVCPGDKIDNTFKPNNTDISAKIKSLLAQIKILQEKIRGLSPTLPIQTIPNDYISTCVGNGCSTETTVWSDGQQNDWTVNDYERANLSEREKYRDYSSGGTICQGFSRNLSIGSRGDDVLQLQQILIGNGLLQSSSGTGYFGQQTKVAVGLWQMSSGIPQVGIFGPKSRAFLKQNCGNSGVGGTIIPDKPSQPPQYFCTKEMVACPDGSYVGRTGPKCEAVCTTSSAINRYPGNSNSESCILISNSPKPNTACPGDSGWSIVPDGSNVSGVCNGTWQCVTGL